MRKKILSFALLLVLLMPTFALLSFSYAATEDEIEQSIIDGLAWLAGIQNLDGSWPGDEPVAKTGLAVLKFIDRAKELGENPFSEEYEYNTTVYLGLEYIFLNAHKMNISAPQPHGDPDSDGDDWGVFFDSGNMWHRTYTTGICLMATGAADACADKLGIPSPVVAFGPLAGQTYEDVIEDTVDYLAFGQNDANWERGGWGYYENYGWSDNSNTGWVTLGLGYALASGATIPQFVYDELEVWINYIQNTGQPDWNDPDPYGGSGYSAPDDWVNVLKTGNLLYQMALVGYPVDDLRVTDAVNYQERHWNYSDPDPGWKDGWLGHSHYQATFCIMKGFEAYGIKTISVGGGDLDWFDDIANLTIASQLGDGSWPSDYWGDEILATTWALLTLERVVAILRIHVSIDIKPGSWPNPINKGSKGVISVAICGTEDIDVMMIDTSTMMLYNETSETGVAPLRWSYEDVATPFDDTTPDDPDGHEMTADGFVDLVLKFDTQEVVGTLGLCGHEDWEYVKLFLKGNLFDEEGGTPIEGFDWVRIQSPKGKGKS